MSFGATHTVERAFQAIEFVRELTAGVMANRAVITAGLRGALYGGMNARVSTPMLLPMYQSGDLKLDELVTRKYRLEDINEAIADLRAGTNIRGTIVFDTTASQRRPT